MLRTFLEAKNILRHRDRFPKKDLKLRVVILFSSSDRFPFELLTNLLGFGLALSNFRGFLSPCLAVDLELLEEGEEEAVKRGRFCGAEWKEERLEELEEHLTVTVAWVGEFHDHPHGDWAAMAQSLRALSSAEDREKLLAVAERTFHPLDSKLLKGPRIGSRTKYLQRIDEMSV